MSTSGVGTQSRWIIQGLINTRKWSFRCFGGAIKHEDYATVTVNPDFIIKPTNGFGDRNMLRQALAVEKPDVLLLFTDPRFFIWIWEMEDEIHQVCPIAYNHLWDNPPWPEFNRVLYESTDLINCINWPTYEMVHQRFPEKTNYVPHAVPKEVYAVLPAEERQRLKRNILGKDKEDHFTALYVGRNARRKMPSDILASWKLFLAELEKRHGHRRATLVMHTDPLDPEGPNLHHVIDMFHLKDNVVFSKERIGFGEMNVLYNVCDTLVNFSCFPAGTNVATQAGLRPIEDIAVGEHVMTHKGTCKRVTQAMARRYTGKLCQLKTSNNQLTKCTPEHPIWAIRRDRLTTSLRTIPGNTKALIRDHVTEAMVGDLAEFIPAAQLNKGDICVYAARVTGEVAAPVFDLTKYVKDTSYARHTVIDGKIVFKASADRWKADSYCAPACVRLTPALAYVLGNWIADGSTNGFAVAFNAKDEQKMQLLERMLADSFGCKSQRSTVHSSCVTVNPINGSIIERFVNDVCGQYSHGKHVPEFVFSASEKVKHAFVAGLMAGDGCVLTHPQNLTKMSRYRTVSSKLAMGLKDVLVSLGHCVSMRHDDNSHGYNKSGMIWCLEWRDRVGGYNGSCRSWNVGKKYVLETVTAVSTVNVTDVPVYNLEVECFNTYRLQGFNVHNCNEGFGLPVLEAKMCKKPVIAIKTGGLTRQVEDHETGVQFGVGMEPEVRMLVGNQMVPYIMEDAVSHATLAQAFTTVYEMGPEGRERIGELARDHALKHYNIDSMISEWDRTLTNLVDVWRSDKRPPRWEKIEL